MSAMPADFEMHIVPRFRVLAAVDNADLDSPEAFKSNQRELRVGRALAIVQSVRQPGVIRMLAHAEGFQDATVEIQVRPPSDPIPTLP